METKIEIGSWRDNEMNIKDFKWTREPDDYTLTDDKIEIITQPETDLWQRTYYHFRNDNAPVLQIETEERFFSFIVKTDFILDDDRRKMQSFLKKHFMRRRIWIHRCMYSRKIIMQLLLMKSIRNFWQKCWQIQRCGHCSIHWRRR